MTATDDNLQYPDCQCAECCMRRERNELRELLRAARPYLGGRGSQAWLYDRIGELLQLPGRAPK